ncbi:hypothetical protein OZ411_41205 [Bradyrhizobium sp. Arg237L]|uniref:hypothetical protein n=1 Tax=Bradyrhizobium sp. Arg237L TaxID=3003352 RepID=UPI00249E57A3|nr:hypothetical protein [Bradyrhizobium sp. Arg237L]MDI4239213.1 hypothetical protein [Bradyrhizobium sp. Arg237L]
MTATTKGNQCAVSMRPAEAGEHVTGAACVPTRRDRGVRALQTIYLGVACYVGLSDCADRLEAIAREEV